MLASFDVKDVRNRTRRSMDTLKVVEELEDISIIHECGNNKILVRLVLEGQEITGIIPKIENHQKIVVKINDKNYEISWYGVDRLCCIKQKHSKMAEMFMRKCI